MDVKNELYVGIWNICMLFVKHLLLAVGNWNALQADRADGVSRECVQMTVWSLQNFYFNVEK